MGFKVGDIVYFIDSWTENCHKAKIISIMKESLDKVKDVRMAELEDLTLPGNTACYVKDLYRTKEECIEAIKTEQNSTREEYCKQINSVEDLVKFMYNYNVATCEEYTDWVARDVAKSKAKELLGIDL